MTSHIGKSVMSSFPQDAIPALDRYLANNCLLLYQCSRSHTLNLEGGRFVVMIARCNRNALVTVQRYSNRNVCKNILLTFTFRAFSRCFCPKRLTISTFVTRKKQQHITVDKVKNKKNRKGYYCYY